MLISVQSVVFNLAAFTVQVLQPTFNRSQTLKAEKAVRFS